MEEEETQEVLGARTGKEIWGSLGVIVADDRERKELIVHQCAALLI